MIISILSGLLVVTIIPLLQYFTRHKTGYVLALLPLALFIYFSGQFLQGVGDNPIEQSLPWNTYFDLSFSFYLDGLSLLFALLITGIGALIFFYAGHYMKGYPHQSRFFAILSVFMASMLGLVLANNLLTLIVFWEMTSITSFLLIGFDYQKEQARAAAYQGLIVTGLGGLAMLAGLVLMGQVADTYSISEILQSPEVIRSSSMYLPILLCVLLGAFTKSAQVPFHFWLPNAMAAPTPISAYLHSATMVKAGVYFVARFFPVLGGTTEWQAILVIVGGLTMLTGAIEAFRSVDLKHILAYSTISALGIMMLAFGIGTEVAIAAGLAYIIAHALYKSTLFMLVGIVDKKTGTRLIRELPGRLYKKMKIPAVLVALSALSFAGIIPFFGFIAKEKLVKMSLQFPNGEILITPVLLITSALFVAITLIFLHGALYRGDGTTNPQSLEKTSLAFYLAPAISALAGLYFGFFQHIPSSVISAAGKSFKPDMKSVHLALWHGWNQELLLSIISIVVGFLIYRLYPLVQHTGRLDAFLRPLNPSQIYHRSMAAILSFAKWQRKSLQTGYIRYYIMITVLTILAITGFSFIYKAGFRLNTEAIEMYVFEIVLGLIMTIALIFILSLKSEIGSILSLGIVAIVVSIIFLEYGAPDLAITWFLVDTLTVTLFVLVIHKLPKTVVPKSKLAAFRDAVISLGIGGLITAILFSLTYNPLNSKLKSFYAAKSYTEAHGKNIVNVILVDFRALDTFGEIAVLSIAALGVFAMIGYSSNPLNKKA